MVLALSTNLPSFGAADGFDIAENDQQIQIASPSLEAVIRKKGYVTGVAGGTFVDKKTGFRDAGFGLDIVDWIMGPGSDEAYRDQLKGDLKYEFTIYHGQRAKRSIEGPQIAPKRELRRGSSAAISRRDELQIQHRCPGQADGFRGSQLPEANSHLQR